MKKIIISLVIGIGVTSLVHSQTFNIFTETNQLLTESGSAITPADKQGFNIFAAPYAEGVSAANNTFFANLEAKILSSDSETALTGIGELNTFLASLTWTELSTSAIGGIDFQASSVSTSQGSRPLLFVTNAESFGAIGLGSQLGLVGGTTTAGSFGLTNYAFGAGANSLNQFYIGNPGSLQMVQVVPEPSMFAALAGLMAVGFVALRRRK